MKLSIVAASDDDMAIRHRKHLIGHDAGMGIAHPLWAFPGGEVIEVLIGLRGQHAVKQCHIDVLPLARPSALGQGGLYADDPVKPGEDIGKSHADLLRHALGLTGDLHDAGHALDHKVITCLLGARAVLTKAGDRAIHQLRILRRQGCVVETEFRQPADFEILNQDIC